jgi:hypothetical protein
MSVPILFDPIAATISKVESSDSMIVASPEASRSYMSEIEE